MVLFLALGFMTPELQRFRNRDRSQLLARLWRYSDTQELSLSAHCTMAYYHRAYFTAVQLTKAIPQDNIKSLFCIWWRNPFPRLARRLMVYVSDRREDENAERRSFEMQSRWLMACKVISCGLPELNAASLGCNSRRTCPLFIPK